MVSSQKRNITCTICIAVIWVCPKHCSVQYRLFVKGDNFSISGASVFKDKKVDVFLSDKILILMCLFISCFNLSNPIPRHWIASSVLYCSTIIMVRWRYPQKSPTKSMYRNTIFSFQFTHNSLTQCETRACLAEHRPVAPAGIEESRVQKHLHQPWVLIFF